MSQQAFVYNLMKSIQIIIEYQRWTDLNNDLKNFESYEEKLNVI